MMTDQNEVRERIDLNVPPNGDGPSPLVETRTPPWLNPPVPAPAPGRRSRRLLVVPILLILLAVAVFFGYRYWEDQQLYVSTDNALVIGSMVQVGSANSGRVASVAADVGDRVTHDQVVATVTLPSQVGASGAGTPIIGFRGTSAEEAPVRAPIDGIVIYRDSNPGDSVTAGQPILTVVDPAQLWVQAQIEETKINRVHVGQAVEATADALGGRTLLGTVVAINPATASTFSLIPQNNTSGNFTKVTQLVPVKIAVDYGELPLVYGSSVEVKIQVQGRGTGNG
jgi:multidrug resistance efflux pump